MVKNTQILTIWCRRRQKQALCNMVVTLFVAAMSAAKGRDSLFHIEEMFSHTT
jgi:hypothetical protein